MLDEAPGGPHLASEYAAGRSPFSPADVVTLVEAGTLKVAARETFLNGDRSTTGWTGQHWLDGFDDRLLAIHRDDVRRPHALGRVVGLPPEIG